MSIPNEKSVKILNKRNVERFLLLGRVGHADIADSSSAELSRFALPTSDSERAACSSDVGIPSHWKSAVHTTTKFCTMFTLMVLSGLMRAVHRQGILKWVG